LRNTRTPPSFPVMPLVRGLFFDLDICKVFIFDDPPMTKSVPNKNRLFERPEHTIMISANEISLDRRYFVGTVTFLWVILVCWQDFAWTLSGPHTALAKLPVEPMSDVCRTAVEPLSSNTRTRSEENPNMIRTRTCRSYGRPVDAEEDLAVGS